MVSSYTCEAVPPPLMKSFAEVMKTLPAIKQRLDVVPVTLQSGIDYPPLLPGQHAHVMKSAGGRPACYDDQLPPSYDKGLGGQPQVAFNMLHHHAKVEKK